VYLEEGASRSWKPGRTRVSSLDGGKASLSAVSLHQFDLTNTQPNTPFEIVDTHVCSSNSLLIDSTFITSEKIKTFYLHTYNHLDLT
jgi:hypothetical protein